MRAKGFGRQFAEEALGWHHTQWGMLSYEAETVSVSVKSHP